MAPQQRRVQCQPHRAEIQGQDPPEEQPQDSYKDCYNVIHGESMFSYFDGRYQPPIGQELEFPLKYG